MSSGFVLLSRFPSFHPARFPLPEGLTTVGRSSACNFVIHNGTVSRNHAEIQIAGQTATIRDLVSSNGTFLNDERISESPLLVGQQLRFGKVGFLVASADFHDPELESTDETPPVIELEGTASKSEGAASKSTEAHAYLLTPAQRRVLELLLEGLKEKGVADALQISEHTVHSHIKDIYLACGVHSRGELLALFVKRHDDRKTNAPRLK
ncbi:MAG TPA: FHA domain-containing protein [Planctomycetaceae bacterium]|jgi:pSer/pThr/pTyr-binding forkhead associated (FHA) protein